MAILATAIFIGSQLPQLFSKESQAVVTPVDKLQGLSKKLNLLDEMDNREKNRVINKKPRNLLEKQMFRTEQWFQIADDKNFTIQLALLDMEPETKANEFLLMAGKNLNMKHLFVFRAIIRNKPVYSVLYNEYESWDLAVKEVQSLSTELKASGPYLRTVKAIRYEIE